MSGENEEGSNPGFVQANTVAARVAEEASRGVFATGVVLLTGGSEFIVDFVQNLGAPATVVSRMIIPHNSMGRIIEAIERNVEGYEDRFGPIDDGLAPAESSVTMSDDAPSASEENAGEENAAEDLTSEQLVGMAEMASVGTPKPAEPTAQDIYDDMRLDASVESGVYANALMIGHSAFEFKLDFIANLYPKSIVTSRIFLSAPQLMRVLQSMKRTYSQFIARQNASQ